MKFLIQIHFLLIIPFLFSCSEAKKRNEPAEKKKIFKNDTLYINHDLDKYWGEEKFYTDTILNIDGKPHLFSIYAKVNRDEIFEDYYVYEKTGKPVKETFKGYDAEYVFQLKTISGKKVFTNRMTKSDFQGLVNAELLSVNLFDFDKSQIHFEPSFKAISLQYLAGIPESDVGSYYYLFLDLKGKVLYSDHLIDIHGSPDSPLEFSPNGKFFLTSGYIQHSNGQKIKISEDNKQQVGTKIINDNYILVVKEKDSTKLPNASLINPYGRIMKAFDYKGYYSTYSYIIPSYFCEANQNYYLLDSETNNLRVINNRAPEKTYTSDFTKMPVAGNIMQKDEIEFTLTNEIEDFIFYIDTVSGQLRKTEYMSVRTN